MQEIPSPETALEYQITSDPEWVEGMLWGTPRPGHPEGSVGKHTLEVLANVERFARSESERTDLRLIALLHDCAKAFVQRGGPHHGLLARRVGERYLDDERLLCVIEHHDAVFRLLRRPHGQREQMERLLAALREQNALALYAQFLRCDTLTGNKSPFPYTWFADLTGQGDGA